MLTFDSLTTAGWRDGRRFHIRVRQVLGTACGHHRLDAFLCPTVRRHPVSLEKMPPGCAPELAAMSGLPAITLPCGMAETGLPVGMEMLGTVRDELRLMAYAQHVERVLGDMT
ncbi:hypothetical protein CS622_23720 [Salmonella enterica]|nr:hypothetical protein [Salmonella enterica]EBC2149916.1 hypothetical protein [Salmonella enterica]EIE0789395.1 hypothetical protein [Salmonella enterica]EJI4782587.1 hypothetical protein [Salmonella enterica]